MNYDPSRCNYVPDLETGEQCQKPPTQDVYIHCDMVALCDEHAAEAPTRHGGIPFGPHTPTNE